MNERTGLVLAALLVTGVAIGAVKPAAAQTPLSACGTLTKGSYVLTKNLTTTGHCLTLVNNFITVDLAGFVITGNGVRSGIRAGTGLSLKAIVIRGGTITNFQTGIDLLSSSEIIIHQVRIVRNLGHGINVNSHCKISDTIIDENGGMGIQAIGTNNMLVGNIVSNNGSTGAASNGLITTNIVIGNKGDGVAVGLSSTVIGNHSALNTGHGLTVGSGSTVVNNSVRSNGGFGLHIQCPSNVFGNTATNNAFGNVSLNGPQCGDNFNVTP